MILIGALAIAITFYAIGKGYGIVVSQGRVESEFNRGYEMGLSHGKERGYSLGYQHGKQVEMGQFPHGEAVHS